MATASRENEGETAAGCQRTLDGNVLPAVKRSRMSYTREYKLEVVKFYRENNLYQTAKRFSLNTKTVGRWVADAEKIKKSKKASKRVAHSRRCQYPDLEEELYREYKNLRRQGVKVKGFWFRTRAKQLLQQMHPDDTFHFSDCWFNGFKSRHRISLRRPTNTSQRPAADKREAIQQFHRTIRKLAAEERPTRPVRRFTLKQIANVDQTPLPFSFTNGGTYADTGDKTVWVRGGASGLDKRQCTAQITLFADGEPRVKPLLIFKGKGKRISFREKVRCYLRVHLYVHYCTMIVTNHLAVEEINKY